MEQADKVVLAKLIADDKPSEVLRPGKEALAPNGGNSDVRGDSPGWSAPQK